MSITNKPLPAEPQENAKNDGVAAVLSDEAVHNLTGFFDVLIQMDLAQKQRNEQGVSNGHGTVPKQTNDTSGRTVQKESFGSRKKRNSKSKGKKRR